MPETLRSISIFAFVLNEHGQPVQAWETVSDGSEIDAIKEAKSIARAYAGVLVARRDGIPAAQSGRRSCHHLPHWQDGRFRLRDEKGRGLLRAMPMTIGSVMAMSTIEYALPQILSLRCKRT